MQNPTTTLVDESFARYRPARVFVASIGNAPIDSSGAGGSASSSTTLLSPVSSLDVEPTEAEFGLASHGKHNALTLFNTRLGVVVQRINYVGCEHGVVLSRFTRQSLDATVLLAPRVSNMDTTSYTVKLHALKSNSTLRAFSGHAHQVCALVQSPVDQCFLSSDLSGETRIWDARESSLGCIGRLRALDPSQGEAKGPKPETHVAYHPSGASFYVVTAAKQQQLRLVEYDLRKLTGGPMRVMAVGPELGGSTTAVEPTDLKVSPDGQVMVICTTHDRLLALNTGDGTFMYEALCVSSKTSPAIVSFSADSKYLSTQASEGAMILGAKDGRLVNMLETGEAVSAARISCFSPKTELLITSGEDATVFWSSSGSNSG